MATLLDVDWATGSTCSATNLKDGVFTTIGDEGSCCSEFGIGTDGPGGRNYFKIILPSSDGSNYIRGHTSLGNPATLYVRMWFRYLATMGYGWHNVVLEDSLGGTPLYILRGAGASPSFSIEHGGGWYDYIDGITTNQWYRLELKITGGGGSSGAIYVRLDGVDITNRMYYADTGWLTDDNGGITLPQLNYFSMWSYYHDEGPGERQNIAGVKITDGPDWIGGDNMKLNGTMQENMSKINGVSLSSIDKIIGYDF